MFGLEDSGKGESIIRYQAYPNEKPVFTSDVTIEGWEKLDDTIPELPKAAIGNVWVNRDSEIRRSSLENFIPCTTLKGVCQEPVPKDLFLQ